MSSSTVRRHMVPVVVAVVAIGLLSACSSAAGSPATTGSASSTPAASAQLGFTQATGTLSFTQVKTDAYLQQSGTVQLTASGPPPLPAQPKAVAYRSADGVFNVTLDDSASSSDLSIGLPVGKTTIASAAAAPSPDQGFEITTNIPGTDADHGNIPVYNGYGSAGENSKGVCTVTITETGNGPVKGTVDCPSLETETTPASDDDVYALTATFTLTP